MISYAQNAEDVVLARVFAGQATGRYVDLGAGHPVEDSVTKHFYDLGWRGINIEPEPTLAARLRAERPEDVNRAVAIGAAPGRTVLHVVDGQWGRSTVDDSLAARYREGEDWPVSDVEVEVLTLAALLDEHPGEVDFLKIDVEGAERAVVEGADWSRHRPRVIVVEATEPGSPKPAFEEWEPVLLDAGYRLGLFDGLNRFYAAKTDGDALALLTAPANIFDDYVPYATALLREDREHAQEQRAAEVAYIRRLQEKLQQAEAATATQAARLEELGSRLEAASQDTEHARRYSAALENRIAELERQRDA